MEEINLTIDPSKLVFIYRYSNEKDTVTGVRFCGNVYEYRLDTEPTMNPMDFSEAYWLTPEELREKLLDPNEPLMKGAFLPAIEGHYLK